MKNENLIGIIPANNSDKNSVKKIGGKKKYTPPTKFWKQLVKLWFDLYAQLLPPDPEDKSPAKPCFDQIEAFQYKIIIRELIKRAEQKNIEWTEIVAVERTKLFLLKAWDDDFVSKNFMLRIISNNKTKIFNNQITPKKNGTINSRSATESPNVTVKPKGSFGHIRSRSSNR